MANGLYTSYKQQLGEEKQNMAVDDFRAILSDAADYTVNLATHDFYDDVAAAARVAVLGSALTSPTFTGGTFDTADFVWTSVSGDQSEQIILVNFNGNGAATDAARMLLMFYDTGITGMPVTPNGGNINVTVNASGWFSL